LWNEKTDDNALLAPGKRITAKRTTDVPVTLLRIFRQTKKGENTHFSFYAYA
jgi:hypothetical protein